MHGLSLPSLSLASAAPPPPLPLKLPPTAQPVPVSEELDFSSPVLRSILHTLGWLLLLYFATACCHAQSQARVVNVELARLLDAGAYKPAQAVPSGPSRSGVVSVGTSRRKPLR